MACGRLPLLLPPPLSCAGPGKPHVSSEQVDRADTVQHSAMQRRVCSSNSARLNWDISQRCGPEKGWHQEGAASFCCGRLRSAHAAPSARWLPPAFSECLNRRTCAVPCLEGGGAHQPAQSPVMSWCWCRPAACPAAGTSLFNLFRRPSSENQVKLLLGIAGWVPSMPASGSGSSSSVCAALTNSNLAKSAKGM